MNNLDQKTKQITISKYVINNQAQTLKILFQVEICSLIIENEHLKPFFYYLNFLTDILINFVPEKYISEICKLGEIICDILN